MLFQSAKNTYHLLTASLANLKYGFPSKKMTVIGITGTDGKTTTTGLIYHILTEAGCDASMISTVGAIINRKDYDIGFHVTTPSSFALQKFLSKTISKKNTGQSYMVLETTSHSLDQHRVFGIDYTVGVLTNVTHEHLDYHKTYENYVRAKTKLLLGSKIAVTNMDDESFKLVNKILISHRKKFVTYGMHKEAMINPVNFPFKTKMIGGFNLYNCLAAIAVTKALGINDGTIRKAILSFNPPVGREEVVYENGFSVMIDFAHTPNAFKNILSAVRKETKGRIIHVFGSAGLRDRTKRPMMGRISVKYTDIIILTSEDPRSEGAIKIMDEIMSGIKNANKRLEKKTLFRIANRQEAINLAVKLAEKGDLVIITGKGHEGSMNYGKGEIPWNEHKAVALAIKKRETGVL